MHTLVGLVFLFAVVLVWLAITAKSPKHRSRTKGARAAERWHRGYVGNPGETIHMPVTYVDRRRFENNGRVGYRYRFREEQGRCLVWFTSYPKLGEEGKTIQPGTSLNLRATVENHKDFHGVHETVVNRVRVESS
jgi:hypothetical protein